MTDWAARRADIKAMLDEIDGVKGWLYRPTVPKDGDAWPALSATEQDDGLIYVTWSIHVYLPQDEAKASKWQDEHNQAFFDHLQTPDDTSLEGGYVESIVPSNVAVGAAAFQYGLTITLRSE